MEGLGVGMRSVAGRARRGFTTGACGFTDDANRPLQGRFGPPDAGGRRLTGPGPTDPKETMEQLAYVERPRPVLHFLPLRESVQFVNNNPPWERRHV